MIRIIRADGSAELEQLQAMRERAALKNADIEQAVSAVMQDVKENGLAAVERYSERFDHTLPYEISPETLDQAYKDCSDDDLRTGACRSQHS